VRQLTFIADDYGLAPGVSEAVLELVAKGRLSGTSCMTVFGDWEAHAARLAPLLDRALAGLHLTLTDQPALSGRSSVAPKARLPALPVLVASLAAKRIGQRDVEAELEAQYDRFRHALGREPDFIDGHQHVHFLPCVRAWLVRRFAGRGPGPRLRGAPRLGGGPTLKLATVAALAKGFDRAMSRSGFTVMAPLAGIYDWHRPEGFAPAVRAAVATMPSAGVFMCHPGHVDRVLRERDAMLDARETEHAFLASEAFAALLADAGAAVAGRPT
jgi:predicted glycoside hydrolase/deacetylase ChbG (UPF0249 family)